jgi:hypothetical protein
MNKNLVHDRDLKRFDRQASAVWSEFEQINKRQRTGSHAFHIDLNDGGKAGVQKAVNFLESKGGINKVLGNFPAGTPPPFKIIPNLLSVPAAFNSTPIVKFTFLIPHVQSAGKKDQDLIDTELPKGFCMFRQVQTKSLMDRAHDNQLRHLSALNNFLRTQAKKIFKQRRSSDGISFADAGEFMDTFQFVGSNIGVYSGQDGRMYIDTQVGGKGQIECTFAACDAELMAGSSLAIRTVLRFDGLENACRQFESEVIQARLKPDSGRIEQLLEFDIQSKDIPESEKKSFKDCMKDITNTVVDVKPDKAVYLAYEAVVSSAGGDVPAMYYDFSEYNGTKMKCKTIANFCNSDSSKEHCSGVGAQLVALSPNGPQTVPKNAAKCLLNVWFSGMKA